LEGGFFVRAGHPTVLSNCGTVEPDVGWRMDRAQRLRQAAGKA